MESDNVVKSRIAISHSFDFLNSNEYITDNGPNENVISPTKELRPEPFYVKTVSN